MPALFGPLFRDGWRIKFAYRTFPWNSEAPGKAAVHCVITGYTRDVAARQRLFEYDWTAKAHHELKVKTGINAYLLDAANVLITKRSKPLSPELPDVSFGSKPVDGGNLIVEKDDYQSIAEDVVASRYLRPFLGAKEMLHGISRWCLWLEDLEPTDISKSSNLRKRLEAVRVMRSESPKKATQELAATPYLFAERRQPVKDYVMLPSVVSETRKFFTATHQDKNVVASNLVFTAEDPDGFIFAIASSSMFITWQRAVGGRMKNDLRFSNTIVWNNLPLPAVEPKLRQQIIEAGRGVLAAREAIAECADGTRSLADMYNPLVMDKGLLDAHKKLDRLVDKAFGAPKLCTSETQRLEILFCCYRSENSDEIDSNAPMRLINRNLGQDIFLGVNVVSFVGNNGSGKSRALKEIVDDWLTGPVYSFLRNKFSRVLCLSNIVTDPFSSTKVLGEKGYYYLGLRESSNSVQLGVFSKVAIRCIFRIASRDNANLTINSISQAVGMRIPGVVVSEQNNPSFRNSEEYQREKFKSKIGQPILRENEEIDAWSEFKDFLSRFDSLVEGFLIEKNRGTPNARDVNIDFSEIREISKLVSELSQCMDVDFDTAFSLFQLFSRYKFDIFYISDKSEQYKLNSSYEPSAGEEMYISLLLRVAAYVKENSLILIDEPEIGLHPGWQQEFIMNIKEILDAHKSVTVILATHSPFIVGDSDLVVKFSKMVDPEIVKYNSIDYSIEEVLYHFFSTRLFSSREIEEYLKIIISWISNGQHDSKPPKAVISSADNLKKLDYSASPTLAMVLNQFDEIVNQ